MTEHQAPSRNPWRQEVWLPSAVRPGTEPWRWAGICVRSLRVAIAIGLAVVATGVVGMGIGAGLHGLGVLRLNIAQPESEALAVGLALTMIGSAILGLSTEAGFRSPSLRTEAAAWETTVTWIPAFLVTLWMVERIESLASRLLPAFSDLFNLVPLYVDHVSTRGLLAGLAGLPLMWLALQYGAPRSRFIGENAPALVYACWMTLVIVTYGTPETDIGLSP